MEPQALDVRFRTIQILWLGLLGGVAGFAGVVVAIITGFIGAWEPTLDPTTAAMVLVGSPLLMVGGILFRRGELRAEGSEEERIAAYQNRIVIASAMQEGGAFLGLVLCLLAGQAAWALGVFALAAAAMGLSRPHREELRQLLR